MQTKTFVQKLCSKYIWINLALMAAVVGIILTGIYYGTSIYTHHGEIVKVPDIRNKKFVDAQRLLEDAGLVVVVSDTAYNRHLPADCILQQVPAPGTEVKSGRMIYVTINSDRKPTIALPDIIDNCSEREAVAKLKILGFKLGETQYIPGEKGWVYGVICRGRSLTTGDNVPVDAMIVLQVGNGQLNAADSLEVTDPVYEPEPEEEAEEDPFEEIIVE